ncbi:MAG: lysostaphin resistance A-like protein, partial [Candidatus Thorarchaeota archaeon]
MNREKTGLIRNSKIGFEVPDGSIFIISLPALGVGISMIFFTLFNILSDYVVSFFQNSLYLDQVIKDLLVLLIAQLIGFIVVIYVLIPFFKVKFTEYYPISIASIRITFILFLLLIGITFISNLFFTSLFTIINLDPHVGYSEFILSVGQIRNPLNIVLFLVTLTFGAAIFEEIVYRRLLISLLEKNHLLPLTTVVISSILFAFTHLPDDLLYGNISGAITHITGVFLLSMILGFAYLLTRNVLFPIIIHAFSNLLGS